MVGQLQPLDQKFPIVDENGKPTLYFIRWAQQKQIDISGSISEADATAIIVQYLLDHQLQEGNGITLTPDGNLTNNPTIAADVQAILDQISTAQGSVLFRGASGWQALAPGTSGQFLKTNGAGADITWAAAGGGGGGGGFTPFTLTNPGAESASTTGWTVATGSFTAATTSSGGRAPYQGSYLWRVGANAVNEMYQDIDISAHATAIDAGTAVFMCGCAYLQDFTTQEIGGVAVEFYDGSSVLLQKRIYAMGNNDTNGDYWECAELIRRVPANARTARMFLIADRNDGTNNDLAFDEAFAGIWA